MFSASQNTAATHLSASNLSETNSQSRLRGDPLTSSIWHTIIIVSKVIGLRNLVVQRVQVDKKLVKTMVKNLRIIKFINLIGRERFTPFLLLRRRKMGQGRLR